MSYLKKQEVALGEKLGYSLGDVAANLVFQMMMVFQLKFYTDVFGLEGTIAGSVFLIACIFGAFIDPFIGILSDRTNTNGESIALGSCGRHCLSRYSMFSHTITPE